MTEAVQTALGVDADGKAGVETWTAIYQKLVPTTPVNTSAAVPLSDRSERVVGTLLPPVQTYARALVARAAQAGITVEIIQGMRTYAEQNALYAQGRTAPGKVVTNARGGYSNHNFGLAFDTGIFVNGKYADDSLPSATVSRLYGALGALGEALGLTWGGSWTSLQDEPHFELRPAWAAKLSEGDMLAQLRDRTVDKRDLLA